MCLCDLGKSNRSIVGIPAHGLLALALYLFFIFDTKTRNEKVPKEDLPQVIRELSILSLVFKYYMIMVS